MRALELTRVALVVRLIDCTLAGLARDRLLAGCLVGLGSWVLASVDEVRDGRCRGRRDVADSLHIY